MSSDVALSPKRLRSVVYNRHREAARMLAMGITKKVVAARLNMTPENLYVISKQPEFKAEIARLHTIRDNGATDIISEFKELSPDAVDELSRVLYTGETERNRMQAAESILDRAGFAKINKSDISVKGHVNVSRLSEAEIVDMLIGRANKAHTHEVELKQITDNANAVEYELSNDEPVPSELSKLLEDSAPDDANINEDEPNQLPLYEEPTIGYGKE